MSDLIELATCINAMDFATLFLSFPEAYPEKLVEQFDLAEVTLSSELWLLADKDPAAFTAAMHDGGRAVAAMDGETMSKTAFGCLETAKGSKP